MKTIDGFALARNGETVCGEIPVRQLDRLRDQLSSDQGTIHFELHGFLDDQKRPVIGCIIRGSLALICQRCLGAFSFPVDLSSQLVLVRDEAGLPALEDEEEGIDFLAPAGPLDVAALVEEEILLALPIAPRHEEAVCGVAVSQHQEAAPGSSFAALQRLKR